MGKIRIVIEIPESIYKKAQDGELSEFDSCYINGAVADGKPLPEGHGDLKDANIYKAEVNKYIAENKNSDDLFLAGCGDGAYHALHIYDCIPTIIEADKEEGET